MDPELYTTLLIIPGLLISAALAITVWRIIVGPNSLDRLIGLDGMVAMMQSAGATYIAWSSNSTVVYAMMVIAMLAFISTVAVTRFRKRDVS
ncbi:monovalent cation/H+ antiporter complex subunit F [Corynebacterium propinquum]|uniref:monovalent cation/H+ antiporter complex subunit F n=1 Tax=Corynebacterium propinquum TaxID=43769 RepID=UPI0026709B27|nr:monovalent cation/H+ antiporter complex subunit F [Corynebacterium propinquum]WKS27437.1 monovalent cation/H+ antiporter complex subunit F [Corynebacterium propinquum]